MLKNYFKIAIRNIWKQKLFSIINIFGLASGLTVCLLAIAHIKGTFDYDKFHTNKDRIYRILTDVTNKNNDKTAFATSPTPLSGTLKQDYALIENSARIVRTYGEILANTRRLDALTFAADPSFFKIFDYPLSQGSPASEPGTAVINIKTAEKFFGKANPIGKTLQQGNMQPVIITGVLAETPNNSHLKFDILFSLAPGKTGSPDWQKFNESYTYVLLKPGVTLTQLENILPGIAARVTNYLNPDKVKEYSFRAQALTKISPGSEELQLSTYEPQVSGLLAEMAVGLVTLFMAGFNYINLTLARSMSRAREVGIRKTSGALRWQLLWQFMAESVVISLFSLGLAFLMLELVKPMAFVQQWLIGGVVWDWKLWSVFIAFSIAAGLLAGVVPARILSGFEPAQVLRSQTGVRIQGISLRKTLIVLQFSISLIAMISLVTMIRQQNYMATGDYGFNTKNVLTIPLSDVPYERLANEISKLSGVEHVSGTSELFGSHGETQMIKQKRNGADSTMAFTFTVAHDFVPTLNLTLLEGQDLPEISGDSKDRSVLINEEAVRKFGLGENKDAIGKTFWLSDSTEARVAGVIRDFRFTSFSWAIKPLIMSQQSSELRYLNVAVSKETSEKTLAEIKQAWKKLKPYEPFDGQWYDNFLYQRHSHAGDVNFMLLLLGISFSIACLGLLGMVTYNTQTRIKEVGIRKVMGAEIKQIIWLLSRDFVRLLTIAGAIALPLGYTAGYAFLFNFAYHVSIGVETLGLCFGVLLLLGGIIICLRTYRAATANPVEALGNV